MLKWPLLLSLLVIVAACGGRGRRSTGDTSVTLDSAVTMDSGTRPEVGPPDSTTPDTGAPPDSRVPPPPDSGTPPPDTSVPPDTTVPPGGACDNPSDRAAIPRMDYGPMMDEAVADVSSRCGVACITDPDLEACTTACVVTETGGAMSSGCARCYSLVIVCAATSCLSPCLTDPGGAACTACLDTAGCAAMGNTCAGFDLSMP